MSKTSFKGTTVAMWVFLAMFGLGFSPTAWSEARSYISVTPALVFNLDDQGRALRGMDPVAYFTQNRPVAGLAQFSYNWGGAIWLFASQADRDAFAAEPARYVPQYGGFCAYAMSLNALADGDPQAWTVDHGRLFINYSLAVRTQWNLHRADNIRRADLNWPAKSHDVGNQ